MPLNIFNHKPKPEPVDETLIRLGLATSMVGPEFPASELRFSENATEFEFRSRYYRCTQHDHKKFDWSGKIIAPAARHISQPLIGGSAPSFFVPMTQRRPDNPYRLGRTIVNRFTGLIFGQGRWPNIISDDPDTQDMCEALVDAMDLPNKLMQARNFGGSMGAVGLSWWIDKGVPKTRVHQAPHIIIHEWEDEDESIPAHVIELYQYSKNEYDARNRKHVKVWYWSRRDWTRTADVVFAPVQVTKENPKEWAIDWDKTIEHNDGECHFVWIQNLVDDDGDAASGQCDYEGLFEQLDGLDVLNSVQKKGVVSNLDPTLVLNMFPDDLEGAQISKGSENYLAVGNNGQATYLTLGSDVVTAGLSSVQGQRAQILETAECVVPDPNEVVAAGSSSVSIRLMYAPMLNKADLMRTQYGRRGILRLLNQILDSLRGRMEDPGATTVDQRYVHEIQVGDDGEPVLGPDGEPVLEPVQYVLAIPPRVVKEPVLDEAGNETSDYTTREFDRTPGKGFINLEWPEYFPKTSADRQADAGALTSANGGKPLMSQKSSVEQWAAASDRDGQEEYALVLEEAAREHERAQAAAFGGMFPPIGGPVDKPVAPIEATEEPDDELARTGQPLDPED